MNLTLTPQEPLSAFSSKTPTGNWGINFGGGANSTAALLFAHDRGLHPDWVVFADTGSERPETYANIERVAAWCKSVGFPFATTRWIRKDGTFESLTDNCLRLGILPSKAYGNAGCTSKWKIAPLQKWRRDHGHTPTTVAISYDIGEKRRIQSALKRAGMCPNGGDALDEDFWYPLVAWGIDRAACEDRIRAQGWTPAKSACFFCPSMRANEWDELKDTHPDLYQVSLDIERGAKASGKARTASIFRNAPGDLACVCSADGCGLFEQEEK